MSCDNQTARVVILNDEDYAPAKTRCLTLGPELTPAAALSQARKVMSRHRIIRGSLFIEDPKYPATRRDMSCRACNKRRENAFDTNIVPLLAGQK